MKKFSWIILLALAGCHGKKTPDVSGIPVQLDLVRFEKLFFSIDTNQLDASLERINAQCPGFTKDFLYRIMGANANPDSTLRDVRLFIKAYAPLKDSADRVFGDFSVWQQQVKRGLQFVKYYFPSYRLPTKLYTFIGPIDAVFKTANGVFKGTIEQVRDNGLLVVKNIDGEEWEFNLKEIEFLNKVS